MVLKINNTKVDYTTGHTKFHLFKYGRHYIDPLNFCTLVLWQNDGLYHSQRAKSVYHRLVECDLLFISFTLLLAITGIVS